MIQSIINDKISFRVIMISMAVMNDSFKKRAGVTVLLPGIPGILGYRYPQQWVIGLLGNNTPVVHSDQQSL